MPRADLRGLIGNLGTTEAPDQALPRAPIIEPNPEPRDTETIYPTHTQRRPPESVSERRSKPDRTPKLAGGELPGTHFSDFQRKETRLRADQQNALTEHARRLNRAKGTGGQRITDNTLIRVAVDLLLSKTAKLGGSSEAELRRSLGLKGAAE
jgi:hypothetical protein